jgi:hypothetical protein
VITKAALRAASGRRWLAAVVMALVTANVVQLAVPAAETSMLMPSSALEQKQKDRGTESSQTLRWRGPDSNHRSPT